MSIAARTGNCNFEEKWWCRWQQWYNDDFNWLRATTTGGVGTGPNGDHTTGKGINCLVYLICLIIRNIWYQYCAIGHIHFTPCENALDVPLLQTLIIIVSTNTKNYK